MASKVEICNMALVELSGNRVTDIDSPSTNEEKLCNILFDQLADEVMMSGSWTSCITRAALVQTANTPDFEFAYEYQLPTSPKLLKIIDTYPGGSDSYPYVIEGDKFLTNSATVNIKYIYKNTSVDSWDPMLVKAMVKRIKSSLALPLKGDPNLAQMAFQEYEQALATGRAINNQQGSKQVYTSNTLTDSRI